VAKRAPWGHVSRHCVWCGKVGPRTYTVIGWAHKRCMPKPSPRPAHTGAPGKIDDTREAREPDRPE
jgi:hypothetical protein